MIVIVKPLLFSVSHSLGYSRSSLGDEWVHHLGCKRYYHAMSKILRLVAKSTWPLSDNAVMP
jgi:hypothetical protein